MIKKQKSKNFTISILSLVIILLTLVFVINPESFVFAAVPGQTSNLSATSGDSSVVLRWDPPQNSTIDGFYILKDNPNETLDTRRNQSSFEVAGLTNGVTYTFSVAAYNKDGVGVYSNSVEVTPNAISLPSAPKITSLSSGNGEITMVWVATGNDGGSPITGYEIQYTNIVTGVVGTATTQYVSPFTISGLTNGQKYEVRARSENKNGFSPYSEIFSETPSVGILAPQNLAGVAGDTQISLSWLAPQNAGDFSVVGYVLGVSENKNDENIIPISNTLTHVLSNLTNGISYDIRIAARLEGGSVGDFSEIITVRPKTLPNVPTITATPGDSQVTINWSAPESNGSSINSYELRYRKNGGEYVVVSGIDSRINTHVLDGLVNGADYTFELRVISDIGPTAFSEIQTTTPDSDADPQIIGIPQVEAFDKTAVFTWQTNKETTTRVDFGLLNVEAKSVGELNTTTRVINHTALVSDLLSCTTYKYRVFSRDSLNRTTLSDSYSFTTSGCLGDVIEKVVVDEVCAIEGGLACSSENLTARITSPENITQESDTVIFQIKKLDRASVSQNIANPDSRRVWLENHAYKLSAYISEDQFLSNFDNPVGVTMEYTREDVRNIDLSTLSMFHYDEDAGWRILDQCVNNYNPNVGVGEITCQTYDFSIFGLFGEPAVQGSTQSSSTVTGTAPFAQINQNNNQLNSITETPQNQTQEQIQNNEQETENLQFPNNLWIGAYNTDVTRLQTFLNEQGFTVATQGPGSPGQESQYFGERTLQALKKFQTFYADSILKPAGLTQATGYFGVFTRMFVNQNF